MPDLVPKVKNVVIIIKFNITGVNAMAANLFMVFKKLPKSEESETKSKNGNVNRDNWTVKLNLDISDWKPGAIPIITNGIRISKISINGKINKSTNEKILDKNITASWSPCFTLIPEITGMNAAFKAPSANKRLNRLGNLKATKNESDIKLAPK